MLVLASVGNIHWLIIDWDIKKAYLAARFSWHITQWVWSLSGLSVRQRWPVFSQEYCQSLCDRVGCSTMREYGASQQCVCRQTDRHCRLLRACDQTPLDLISWSTEISATCRSVELSIIAINVESRWCERDADYEHYLISLYTSVVVGSLLVWTANDQKEFNSDVSWQSSPFISSSIYIVNLLAYQVTTPHVLFYAPYL